MLDLFYSHIKDECMSKNLGLRSQDQSHATYMPFFLGCIGKSAVWYGDISSKILVQNGK